MAKKKTTSRRAPRSVTPRTFGDGLPSSTNGAVAEVTRPAQPGRANLSGPRAAPGTPVRRPGATLRSGETRMQVPLSQEYSHVGADLRRLAILAVSTFGVMIVLGIIFR